MSLFVYSHPRTGSHYVTALVNVNFFNTDDYMNFYRGHLPFGMSLSPRKIVEKYSDSKFIYIKRNFDDVARSVFKLRNRFGLDVDFFDKF